MGIERRSVGHERPSADSDENQSRPAYLAELDTLYEYFLEADAETLGYAWDDLSPETFGIWIRLMTFSRTELAKGSNHIAHALGQPLRTFNRRLHELDTAGYIRMIARPKKRSRKIVIKKRAVFSRPSAFVNLL